MTAKLSIQSACKAFGGSEDAISLLKPGRSNEEILGQTGATVGVQDASFDVAEGEIFVGLSGSGKSTVVRMLNGLVPPTSGAIMADGEDVPRLPRHDPAEWINTFVRGWLVPNLRPSFRGAQVPVSLVLECLDALLLWVAMLITTAGFALAPWKWAARGIAR